MVHVCRNDSKPLVCQRNTPNLHILNDLFKKADKSEVLPMSADIFHFV